MTNTKDTEDGPKRSGPTLFPLAPAHLAGLGAFQLAAAAWLLGRPLLGALPLAVFLLLCAVAPFVQRLRFFLPVVRRAPGRTAAVALTFDDGPDPLSTPVLLELLRVLDVRATFFMVGQKVRDNPDIVRRVLAEGHEIGNHSDSHDVLFALRSVNRVREEISRCQKSLAEHGVRPLAFRPPVGITNPRLFGPLLEQGLFCAGFSVRGGDRGNRAVRGIAGRVTGRARGGDVIVLHDSAPLEPGDLCVWLEEVHATVVGLKRRGHTPMPLGALLGRPVMEPVRDAEAGPVRAFYDSLADDYDAEQERTGQSPARRVERELFEGFLETVPRDARVLEIGAGTGRFTLELAGRAQTVHALDISPRMLAILERKARDRGVSNIETVAGDVAAKRISGPYDVVCSFSAFEYVPNLSGLLEKCARNLAPGGALYFTTAHASLFRFFVQIGNAMRQGVWLHARTKRRTRRILRDLGMEDVSVTSHGMVNPLNGGLILAAWALKPGRRNARKQEAPLP
ncbi:MAG: polysaccharide deacetylase family protein [Desulfatibacillaceae bacterium]